MELQNYLSFKVACFRRNKDGAASATVPIDFSKSNPYTLDLAQANMNARIDSVQSVFVDNRANPNFLTITSYVTQQVLKIPAGGQAYLPVLAAQQKFDLTTRLTPTVNIQFLNFMVQPCVWSPSDNGSTGTDFSSTPPALLGSLLKTIPANGFRIHVGVQNQSADEIQVVRDDGVSSTPTILLLDPGAGAGLQGGAWESSTFKGRLRIYSDNAGSQVAAYED